MYEFFNFDILKDCFWMKFVWNLIIAGGSSGATVTVAMKFAASLRSDQRCVVILPDGVRNYMTKFLSDSWMKERDFIEDPERDGHWWETKTWSYKCLQCIHT